MCWKKIVKSGIAAGIVLLVVSVAAFMGVGAGFPELVKEYENPAMFRPLGTLLHFYGFFLHPFVVGLLLAFVYPPFLRAFKDRPWKERGLNFGAIVVLVGVVPGLLLTYAVMNVSAALVVSWLVEGAVKMVAGALVIARLFGDDAE